VSPTEKSSAYKILLAEDSPADVMLVRIALKEAGIPCTLDVLHDGEDAIRFIESLDADASSPLIDLLLLDLRLPKRDGEEILRRLRSTERNAQAPVIVMSASDAPSDHERVQRHAALQYFRKPSSLSDYLQLGIIVRDIVGPKKPPAPADGSAIRDAGGAA
jgi:CheY-like chemotaxis protein